MLKFKLINAILFLVKALINFYIFLGWVDMEDKIISCLSKEIIEKFKSKLNIEKEMTEFLESSITMESKIRALELLYLCQLYSNAYIGPDPRGKANMLSSSIYSLLNTKNEEEFNVRVTKLEEFVNILKNAETHPISTTKLKLEDKQKYKDVIW